MKNLTVFFFLFSFFLLKDVIAQKMVPFEIKFKVILPSDSALEIETLKFYISDLKISNKNALVFENNNFFKLVDLSNDTITTISTQIPSNLIFDKIIFNLGIDSNTNKTGIHGGDLDPLNGMYWSWQSGYINLKLEGSSPKCNTRKSKFNFHIGGFTEGQYAIQEIELGANSNYISTTIIDLNIFFNSIDLSKANSVMIPGKEAIELAKLIKVGIRQ